MAKRKTKKQRTPARLLINFTLRWVARLGLALLAAMLLAILLYRFVNPPITPYMIGEWRRIGEIEKAWTPLDEIAPAMARSAVAAEDANFCQHWGFDMAAIRAALEDGGSRGASTITQQVVKNTYLWHGRSWVRKALEGVMTPLVELVWPKARILEVYLNVAEFDDGVFGVGTAAQHYFGTSAARLSDRQAARLAVLLPNPKARDPNQLSSAHRDRAARIADGAATIRADGRAACFED
ncbi:MAG: monofunctional biosynthetic peptidoglycan transglycosylase [Pseudomonadota bacterium]